MDGGLPAVILDSHADHRTGDPARGNYIYRLNLDPRYGPSTVVLSGNWSSDNSSELIFNALATGVTPAGFAGLALFSITGRNWWV